MCPGPGLIRLVDEGSKPASPLMTSSAVLQSGKGESRSNASCLSLGEKERMCVTNLDVLQLLTLLFFHLVDFQKHLFSS